MLNARTDGRKRWQEWGWLASPLAVAPLVILAGFLAAQSPTTEAETDVAPAAIIEHLPERAGELLYGEFLSEVEADEQGYLNFFWSPCC